MEQDFKFFKEDILLMTQLAIDFCSQKGYEDKRLFLGDLYNKLAKFKRKIVLLKGQDVSEEDLEKLKAEYSGMKKELKTCLDTDYTVIVGLKNDCFLPKKPN